MMSDRLICMIVRNDLQAMPSLVTLLLTAGHRLLPGGFTFDLPQLGIRNPLDLGQVVTVLCKPQIWPNLQEILSMSGLPVQLVETQAKEGAPWGRLVRIRPQTLGPSALRRLRKRQIERGHHTPFPTLKQNVPVYPSVFLHSHTTGQIFPFCFQRETTLTPTPVDKMHQQNISYPIGHWIPSVISTFNRLTL